MRRVVALVLCVVLALPVLAAPGVVAAQDTLPTPRATRTPAPNTGPIFGLFTPFAEQVRAIDDDLTLDLTCKSSEPVVARLEVVEAPPGWTTTIMGTGLVIGAVFAGPDGDGHARLLLERPPDVQLGHYRFLLRATAGDRVSELPINIELRDKPSDALSLTAGFTTLSGRRMQFLRYNLTLRNEGEQTARISLTVEAPPDLETELMIKGEQVKYTVLDPGATTVVNMVVRPAIDCVAGEHTVLVRAFAGSAEAQHAMTIKVHGEPLLSLTGPSAMLPGGGEAARAEEFSVPISAGGRTSGDVRRSLTQRSGGLLVAQAHAGSPAEFEIKVRNGGSMAANNVRLSATQPSGWSVTFDPEVIETLNVGQELSVRTTIRPSPGAIVGDYLVTLIARAEGSDEDTIGFRITVPHVTLWRWAGVAATALALAAWTIAVLRSRKRFELANG